MRSAEHVFTSETGDLPRAALRGGGEHSKHPTGDYCVYCLSQWPCVEAGEQ